MPLLAEQAERVLKKAVIFFDILDFVLLSGASEARDGTHYESVYDFPSLTLQGIVGKIRKENLVRESNGKLEVFNDEKKTAEIGRGARIFSFE